MVTLQTADSALKTFYLDAVTKEIDEKSSVFFSMIEKTSANVVGKSVTKVIKTGVSNGIGAGSETGDLPKGDNGAYIALNAPLKNLYGTIEISDKAIRASANNEGAFVNLLNEEMETLVQSAKYNFSRMLFGDGSGKIGEVIYIEGNDVVQLDNSAGLEEGMCVDVWQDGVKILSNCKIKSVDQSSSYVGFADMDFSTMAPTLETGATVRLHDTEENYELTGLGAIFSQNPLYGVARDKGYMKPFKRSNVGAIDEELLQLAIDKAESAGGSTPNIIICSWGVRRALIRAFKERNYPITNIKIGDSISALSFNGIPVVVDRFCPKETMYILNTNDFKLCQLCDWQWMEGEDGKVLKQVAGKPVYTATLVKYAELICQKPCGQAMLTGIVEA